MSEQQFKEHIAQHLKSIRKGRALSLDAVAKLTGVSKAMLGQIERQESSPTIATLWKISSGLETSFSAFFASPSTDKLDQDSFPDDPNMKVKPIFPYQDDTKIEVLEICLINGHEQHSEPHNTGMIEHVHVKSGELSIYFGNTWHDLKVGDSIRFFADQPHAYKALTDSTVFHNIICYC